MNRISGALLAAILSPAILSPASMPGQHMLPFEPIGRFTGRTSNKRPRRRTDYWELSGFARRRALGRKYVIKGCRP